METIQGIFLLSYEIIIQGGWSFGQTYDSDFNGYTFLMVLLCSVTWPKSH